MRYEEDESGTHDEKSSKSDLVDKDAQRSTEQSCSNVGDSNYFSCSCLSEAKPLLVQSISIIKERNVLSHGKCAQHRYDPKSAAQLPQI